ncbi:MOSC domain-containing protein [Defluviimonas sp. WL0050]|uniref:MOSC domain-containing protein n=1 Tax=Albidovulum litorale TaxID=2984134 RepID=A0ABT2ZPM0_9RHOB|nr:MOSC domain-containing protein [Defluviimonas sp. WL0050]MCV2872905.1 MOSC domain-containing protein [Defluviimonas sp. WL0050]
MAALARLLATHAGAGRVTWIGVRAARLAELVAVKEAELTEEGLVGDHARAGRRALTLIQAEHLPVIAALCRRDHVTPDLLRRNIVVEGINLTALRHSRLVIGGVEIALTGPCPPCSRMEKALGQGGYNAMRGHGGWYAEVIRPGRIRIGDTVVSKASEPPAA